MNYERDTNNEHNINIIGRNSIVITGITKINNFDNEEFIIDTICGKIGVKGQNLEIEKLDINVGTITINGTIDALSYLTKEGKGKEGFITRLLK